MLIFEASNVVMKLQCNPNLFQGYCRQTLDEEKLLRYRSLYFFLLLFVGIRFTLMCFIETQNNIKFQCWLIHVGIYEFTCAD